MVIDYVKQLFCKRKEQKGKVRKELRGEDERMQGKRRHIVKNCNMEERGENKKRKDRK